MRIISRRKLREFWEKHSTAKPSLLLWYERTIGSNFQTFDELRQVFPSADLVGNFIIFNIGGNKYRLITYIDYQHQIVFIRSILTISESNWQFTIRSFDSSPKCTKDIA